MAPDERGLQERKDSRRRMIVALAASLALHGALFALLFSAPSLPSGSAKFLAISVSSGTGTGPGGGQGETSPRGAETGGKARSKGSVPESDKGRTEGEASAGAGAGATAGAAASAGESAAIEGATGEAGAGFPAANGPVGASKGLASAAGAEGENPGDGAARANGDGGTSAARAGGSAEAGDPVALLAAAVRAAVEERKTYPEAAKRRGTEGTVRLRFSVGEDGRLLSSKLDASSGSTILDRAALKLLASVFPVDNASRRRLEDLRISVHYGLRR